MDLLLKTNDYLISTIDELKQDSAVINKNQELANELVYALELGAKYGNHGGTGDDKSESADDELAAEFAALTVESQQPVIKDASPSAPKQKDENIRVSLSRIEKLLNNVGELSILQSVVIQQGLNWGDQMPQLMRDTLTAMAKIIKETQSLSMSLRMLPMRPTFQKMERIVRDTSKALGKNVELHLSGEETEVDKTILEQIADPLVHLIRNAVDHGLESPDERKKSDKSEVGHINLTASHRAGQIVIEIKDDGRGLDSEKLIKKAKEKGIISQDSNLTPEQAYQLIFAPGFSTKEEVTDVSGRGVGMDVVKTNITSLQGTIEIETELGRGTCFRVCLPLTLAIIDCIIIHSNEDRFVVPLVQVSEFFRPQETDLNFVYDRTELLTLRNESLAAFRLPTLLGQSTKTGQKPAWNLTALIIRESGGQSSAILVDRIVAQQQVVIKPIGNMVKGTAGIMGSAILGDGKPVLILDLLDLIKSKSKPNIKLGVA
jgi:two-component system chemotaxis sensor kinase CheA